MSPDDRALVDDYLAGVKISQICATRGVHPMRIYRTLGRAGLEPSRYPRGVNIIENAEWLADNDCSLREVCDRLRVRQDTFWTFCKRLGRLDLYERLADREPDADHRRAIREGIRRSKEVA